MPRKAKAAATSKAAGSSELFDELLATSKTSSKKASPSSKKPKQTPSRDFSMLFSKRGMVQYSFSSSPSPVKLVTLTKPSSSSESPLTKASPVVGKPSPKGGVQHVITTVNDYLGGKR